MKKIYYERQGRKYVPVSEYDSDLMDSFPKGAHLVMCYPGGSSRVFNIEPDHASMIAAGRIARQAMTSALVQASELKLSEEPKELTPEQRAAWEHLIEVFGDSARRLTWSSANDIVDAGMKVMMWEAEQLLSHPAVRDAWDQFQTVAKLVSDGKPKQE